MGRIHTYKHCSVWCLVVKIFGWSVVNLFCDDIKLCLSEIEAFDGVRLPEVRWQEVEG